MNQTIFAQEFLDAGSPFFQEMPASAIAGHPYLDMPTPLAIMNDKGSGVTLKVRRANLRPNTGPNALTAILSVRRITAISAGTDVEVEKFDSANADLPSQVVIRKRASSVTPVANSTTRRTLVATELNPTRALSWICSQNEGDSRKGLDSGEIVRLTGDADVTGYVLREGEGLAFIYDTKAPSHSYAINFRFRNVATGATYRIAEVVTPRYMAGDAPLAILNGSGSGVVLEVEKAQAREIGTDEVCMASWVGIEGLSNDGTEAGYVLADSASPLPSGVRVRCGAVANRPGSKVGAIITNPHLRRIILAEPPYGPGISGGPQICRRGIFAPDLVAEAESEIVLREGQGFACVVLNAGAQLSHEATMIVEIVPPAETYPPEGRVRQGVQYGPTGAEYEGTEVIPAQADVKTGVGYGEDGTEFTGSYSGGGGGSGVSRGRAVNAGS